MVDFANANKSQDTKNQVKRENPVNQVVYGNRIDRILQLQRTIGNQATIQFLQREDDPPTTPTTTTYDATSTGVALTASEGRAHPTNSSQSGHSRERHVLDKAKIYTASAPKREQKKTAFGTNDQQNTAVAGALNSSDGQTKVAAVLAGTSPREFIVASFSGGIYDVRRGSVFKELTAGGVKVGIEKTSGGDLHFVTAYPTK